MNDEAQGAAPPAESERQQVVDTLCQAFADDRLGVDEFERRVGEAHRAATTAELRELLVGLPRASAALVPRPPAADVARPPAPAFGQHPLQPVETVRPHSFIAGVMGGGSRSGAWYPARTNYAIGVMGGFSLDLRDAPLPPGETEIRIFCFWGGGEVIVPPDVRVEVSGAGIMGGIEHNQALPGTLDPAAPVVRVTGLCVMGGAEITVRYAGETAKDARERRRFEKKARRKALKAARKDERSDEGW